MPRRQKPEPRSYPVSVEVDGKTYHGEERLERDVLTVTSEYGSDQTQLGGLPRDVLARQLLSEIVHKWLVQRR